jgi:uncharacterized membrane protein YphA (DoxX/SURF4 family)/YHS domain-containing protein
MNKMLWTLQVLLALLFLFAGVMKLVLPIEQMTQQMPVPLPGPLLQFVGVCEVLGGLGLVLPGLLRIRPGLTPLAAALLVIIMVGATVITLAGGVVLPALFPLLVGILLAFVAYGRWRLAPHHGSSRRSMVPQTLVAVVALSSFAADARAGEFYGKDGVAIKGYDPVAYFTDGKAVAGSPEHTAEYQGSIFHFSSQENRDVFAADPAKYAPQYGGFCAFGTAGGYKAKIEPAAFTVVDGKLYLNYDERVQKQWRADIPKFVAKADQNWPEVSRQTKVVE